MDLERNNNRKEAWLELKRPCWKMVQEDDPKDESPFIASKIGGKRPYLSLRDNWPLCLCGKEMSFFFQVNLSNFPKKIRKVTQNNTGLLQLFICTNNDCLSIGFAAFSRQNCVRIVHPKEKSLTYQPSAKIFPSKRIIKYTKETDYPHIYEDCVAYDNFKDEEIDWMAKHLPKTGDKLSGWPVWIQSPEYSNCPRCNKRMIFLWQQELVSLSNYMSEEYIFGDVRTGYITQCPIHKNVLAIVQQ